MDTPDAIGSPANSDTNTLTERRIEARTGVSELTCDAGRVVDLTTRGMRLSSRKRWRAGERRTLRISDGAHALTIEARCIWDRHDGLFQHSIGLAFDAVAPEQEGMLLRFASEHATSQP